MARGHAEKTVNPVRSAHATVMAVNAAPVGTVANAKNAQTCASRPRPLSNPLKRAKQRQWSHRKQYLPQHPLQQLFPRHLSCNRSVQPLRSQLHRWPLLLR